MSTSDNDPAPFQPTDPDASTSTVSGRVPTTPTTSRVLSQKAPDAIVKPGLSSHSLRSANLNKARVILREHVGHMINLPMSYLWKAYPPNDDVLGEVKQHLRNKNFLTQGGKWNPAKATEEQFSTRGTGREIKIFAFFSDLMNAIL